MVVIALTVSGGPATAGTGWVSEIASCGCQTERLPIVTMIYTPPPQRVQTVVVQQTVRPPVLAARHAAVHGRRQKLVRHRKHVRVAAVRCVRVAVAPVIVDPWTKEVVSLPIP